MKKVTLFYLLVLFLLSGCGQVSSEKIIQDKIKILEKKITELESKLNGKETFENWDKKRVREYLIEVENYVKEGYSKNFISRQEIVDYYKKYFVSELAIKIAFSLFEEIDGKMQLIATDAGYVFFVPKEDEMSDQIIDITANEIMFSSYQKEGLYYYYGYKLGFRDGVVKIVDWEVY